MNHTVQLTGGVLAQSHEKVVHALMYIIDADLHAKTYEGEHIDSYAEPEFTGKYLDLCMKIYHSTQNKKALENAQKVVESILRNQRSDGYLGGLRPGMEYARFSVWSQAFTILGLLSYCRETGCQDSLNAAKRCADYAMEPFISEKLDILDATNYGTQHITILYALCALYEMTGEDRYKEYILYIVRRIKASDLNFFDFDDILHIRSRKGIENLIVLLGILYYARLFDDEEAIASVAKYWQQVSDTQIRNTGNGTIGELWTENGNGCMLLRPEEKPSETCVAVGWIELSLMLFYIDHDPKYLDALDKTFYNHLLASISEDGSDFAYYQPNFGKMVRATPGNMYKCCRYRGLTAFTYLDEMLYYEDEQLLIPMIYTSNHYRSDDCDVLLETDYPFGNAVHLTIKAAKEKTLLLRIPKNDALVALIVNGEAADARQKDGYLCIALNKDTQTEIHLQLAHQLIAEHGQIDGKNYVAFTWGCVLLAAHHIPEGAAIREGCLPEKTAEKGDVGRLHFHAPGYVDGQEIALNYCEYASADDYSVWMPVVSKPC